MIENILGIIVTILSFILKFMMGIGIYLTQLFNNSYSEAYLNYNDVLESEKVRASISSERAQTVPIQEEKSDMVQPLGNEKPQNSIETELFFHKDNPVPERIESTIVTLESLLKKEFDGSGFKIIERIEASHYYETYSIQYTGDGLLLSGTLTYPKNIGDGPFPLIVLNRGYYPTIVYKNGFGFGFEQEYFARRGYVSLHLDYRGYGFSENREDYVNGRGLANLNYTVDLLNAVEAIQKAGLPKIDVHNIGFFGLSMGGGVVLNALVIKPDLAKAAVLWGPVSTNYYDGFHAWDKKRILEEDQFFLSTILGPLDDPKSFESLSSYTYLNRIKTPLEIHQGEIDTDTPLEWSSRLVDELDRLKKDFIYRVYPNVPHIFIKKNWNRAMGNAVYYFDEHLKNNP